ADEGGGASAGGGCCAVDGELPTGGAPADVPCDEGAGTSGADDGAAATSREDDRDDPTSEDRAPDDGPLDDVPFEDDAGTSGPKDGAAAARRDDRDDPAAEPPTSEVRAPRVIPFEDAPRDDDARAGATDVSWTDVFWANVFWADAAALRAFDEPRDGDALDDVSAALWTFDEDFRADDSAAALCADEPALCADAALCAADPALCAFDAEASAGVGAFDEAPSMGPADASFGVSVGTDVSFGVDGAFAGASASDEDEPAGASAGVGVGFSDGNRGSSMRRLSIPAKNSGAVGFAEGRGARDVEAGTAPRPPEDDLFQPPWRSCAACRARLWRRSTTRRSPRSLASSPATTFRLSPCSLASSARGAVTTRRGRVPCRPSSRRVEITAAPRVPHS